MKDFIQDPEVEYRAKQAGVNAVAAFAISPFMTPVQNAIIANIKNSSSISKQLFPDGKIIGAPAFNGMMPFCLRQAVVAAAGVATTNFLSDHQPDWIHPVIKPFLSGTITGTIESIIASPFERMELRKMMGIKDIKLSTVIKGSAGRNSKEWIACEGAIRLCQEYEFSPLSGVICGMVSGAFAGLLSTPLQNAMLESIKNGDGICNNLKAAGIKGFRAGAWRAVLVSAYTVGAGFATRVVQEDKNISR